MENPRLRQVRSFVRRAGRTTTAQSRALHELWPVYGIEPPQDRLDLDVLFGRVAPRVCEIGFGNGEALIHLARDRPDLDLIGVEVYEPGIGHLLLAIEKTGLGNIRIARHDAVEVIRDWLPAECLDRVHLYFPDPWPKKRHHKRRLVQPAFLSMAARALKPGGVLHMATDWGPYAEQMLTVAEAAECFSNRAGSGRYSARPPERPETRFERRGQRLGQPARDLLFERRPD
jgi:tRNA (guanine-N7-)-methyltransferase